MKTFKRISLSLLVLVALASVAFALTFNSPTDNTTATSAQKVVAGDLDGSGKPDLVVACAANVSVLLNNGSGGFGAKTDYALSGGSSATDVVLGSLRGNGILDILCCDGLGHIAVFLGVGDGTFGARTNYTVITGPFGMPAYGLALGDFDEDGKLDVVVAEDYLATGVILLGDGAGGFTSTGSYIFNGTGGTRAQFCAVGHFTSSGHLDVLWSIHDNGDLKITTGNGNGTFNSLTTIINGSTDGVSYTSRIAVADWDGSGHPGFAVVANDRGTGFPYIYVYTGSGGGSFSSAAQLPLVGTGTDVAAGNLYGNGYQDLAISVSSSGGDAFSTFPSNGNGTFGSGFTHSRSDFTSGNSHGTSIAMTDLNGDGNLDVAITFDSSAKVTVWLQPGPSIPPFNPLFMSGD